MALNGGVVRLLLEGLGLTSTSSSLTPVASVTVVGRRRPPYGVPSLLTLAASATVVAPAVCDLVVVDAGVIRLLLKGLGFTSALDGRDCRRAVAGRQSPASPGPNGFFYSIGVSPAVTLDPNGLFFAGSRGLASLSVGIHLECPPDGFNAGVLVGPGIVFRS